MSVGATNKEYLSEIDGLRAIAVMAVLLYHVDLALFSGGFVGVDIFFVISGYLITKNISSSIESGTFTLSKFYVRRFRRLYPALLATISITAISALFILSPEHLARFGREIAAALLSVSNIYFWSESGYFDIDSSFKPLLHTWSLSVEEQFYIVWPTFILLLCVVRSNAIRLLILLAVGATSLWYSEAWVQNTSASAAFYMLPFRVYEFVVGALLVFAPKLDRSRHQAGRSLMTLGGVIMMLYSVTMLDHTTPFPGYSALLPCLGAALVILSGSNLSSRMLLENAVARWLGKVSYSVYLVHWPLVVFYKYSTGSDLTIVAQVLIPIASLLLGYASWRWVEQVYRYEKPKKSRLESTSLALYASVLLTVTIGAAVTFEVSKGSVFTSKAVLTAEQISHGKGHRYAMIRRGCRVLDAKTAANCDYSAEHQTLVFGNSHEPDGYNIWYQAQGSETNNMITFGTINKCEKFLKDIDSEADDDRNCRQRITKLKDSEFIQSLDTVVFSSNQPFHENKAESYDLLVELKSINPKLQIIVIGGYFNLKKDCSFYIGQSGSIESCLDPDKVKYGREDEVNAYAKWQESEYATILAPIYIDKFSMLCAEKTCASSVGDIPFTYDQHHLSLEFAQLIGSLLASTMKK